MSQSQKYFTDRDLAARYAISRASVWRWVKQGQLPEPVTLGPATTRWSLDAILTHEQSLDRKGSTLAKR